MLQSLTPVAAQLVISEVHVDNTFFLGGPGKSTRTFLTLGPATRGLFLGDVGPLLLAADCSITANALRLGSSFAIKASTQCSGKESAI